VRAVLTAVLLAVAVLACGGSTPATSGPSSIALRTQEPVGSETPVGCPAAVIEGVLVADPGSGVALDDPAGFVRPVIWPHGYSGRPGTPIAVVDADGNLIAQVGDRVRIGGGEITGDGAWLACGGTTVLAAGG
jgi:hypothetical protein